ncbi:MAG: hypothetical protein Q8M94_08005 [Ignavibacteria bacterium]|nr:hypothetical protein [Ignavibacteria bacterium]
MNGTGFTGLSGLGQTGIKFDITRKINYNNREGGKRMTQQTNGMPELKYSEETFRAMYEALNAIINSETIVSRANFNNALEALVKASGNEGEEER